MSRYLLAKSQKGKFFKMKKKKKKKTGNCVRVRENMHPLSKIVIVVTVLCTFKRKLL